MKNLYLTLKKEDMLLNCKSSWRLTKKVTLNHKFELGNKEYWKKLQQRIYFFYLFNLGSVKLGSFFISSSGLECV